MNPFTTIPKLLTLYFGLQKYNRNIPAFDRLRSEGSTEEEKALIHEGQKLFIENLSAKAGITFEVTGYENLPDTEPFMAYCNHQSYADVFAVLWLFKDHCQIGYIAKEEWRKIKPLANTIEYTRSIFLKRGNGRDAIRALQDAGEIMSKGFNLAIFPEGTRSQSREIGEFKPGAFKFAEKAKVPILPVTLDGGYHLFEEKGTYQPCTVRITVHPLVHIEKMSSAEQKKAAADIEATIRSAL